MAGLLDGVVVNCSTSGGTSTTLAIGAAVAPYLTPALAGAVDGNTYSYSVIDTVNNVSEYGTGAWSSAGGTIGRNPIWGTSGAATKVNLSGTAVLRISALMEDLLVGSQLGPEFVMINGKLLASVASNNLTIAVKTKTGNDPSTGDPVQFVFRNATAATGDYTVIKVAAALSFTINSTNTLGTASSNVPFRLWIVAINNGGTVLIGAFQSVTGGATPTAIAPLMEDVLQTTGSGANGGNNAGTIYTSSSALSGVAIRILGYMEWNAGLATAGSWASGPTKIQLFGPGIKKPGDVVQKLYLLTSTRTITSSNSLTSTNLSQAISPQSAANLVQVRIDGSLLVGANAISAFFAISRGSTNPFQQRILLSGSSLNDIEMPIHQEWLDAPGSTSSTTYILKIRNNDNATSLAFPSSSGDTASMMIEEIMA